MKQTSKTSYALIKPILPSIQSQIIETLIRIKKGTFRQIATATNLTESQTWKRLSELEAQNKIVASGTTICEVSKRPVTVWKIKTK